MTLLDLARLLRRYIALVIALPVACVVICAIALFAMPSAESEQQEDAVARVIVNSQISGVAGLASSEARQAELEAGEDSDLKVTVKADGGTMTVSVTVAGVEYDEGAPIADGIAERALDRARDFYAAASERENMVPFEGYVEPASSMGLQKDDGNKSNLKYLLVALLGGLFVAVCVVVIIDMVRRPVKSIEGVQEAVELPVLERLPIADHGERLLANVRFAGKRDDLKNVCILPAGRSHQAAEATCKALVEALQMEGRVAGITKVAPSAESSVGEAAEGAAIMLCASLSEGMGGAYASRDADATLLVCAQWSDSLKQLESTAAELRLAGANVAGIVFAPEEKQRS